MMRLMRGFRLHRNVVGTRALVRQRGWWLGIRHDCWVGSRQRLVMRAMFVSETMMQEPVRYRRRYVMETFNCRHCDRSFRVSAEAIGRDELLTEIDTLRRLGSHALQVVGSEAQTDR